METASRSADTRFPIPEATKQAIRAAVFSKIRTSNNVMLDSFHTALEQRGFQPPKLDRLFETFGDSLEPLELTKVRLKEKDLFSILDNPIYSDMLAAASQKNRVQYVSGFKIVGATERAWHVPYVGPTAGLLRKAMDQMNTERGLANYANFLPIIQSSGMGKSRAVDEVARQVFTLPLNLRPSLNKGYPTGDLEVLDWLCASHLVASGIRTRYRIFFEQLSKVVYEVLKDWPVYDSQEELADAFRTWLLVNRAPLYAQIYAECREAVNPAPTSNVASQESTSSNQSDPPEFRAAQALIKLIQQKSGVPPGKELARRTANPAPRRVWLHIYFDEAHSLTLEPHVAEDKQKLTCYQILCPIIDRLRALDLFVVFLSTSSTISTYPAPRSFQWFTRFRDGETPGAQVPFYELVFDQWRNQHLLSEGEHTLEDVCKLGFMVRFGRPLFWTRYECGDSSVKANLVSFARMKLAGQHDDRLDETGQLAVLGVRIGLSFDKSRREAREMENDLVEGHMRIVFSIPKHREYICTDALSEPILAEAAAQLMHINEVWSYGLGVLFKWYENGLISKGERGELLARLLLTKAHDHVLSLKHPGTLPTFTQSILLADFLEALVGAKGKDEIMNAKPNNMPGGLTLAESALGQARLNFTHWAKAGDSSVVTDEAAWIALARSLAWQCLDGQSGINLVTPLMLPSGCDKLERYTVSAIFWQIRKGTARVDIDAERLGFFSPYSADQKPPSPVTAEFANSRPYLTVVLDLGVQVAAGPETAKPQVTRTETNRSLTVPPAKQMSSRNGKPVHPRYSVSILGCSHTTFPSLIPVSEESRYSSLLSPGDYAAENARNDREFQEALSQMKPAWKKDEGKMGSYSQFTRRVPSRLDSAPPPDRSSKAIEIHGYTPDVESGGEQADNKPENGMDVDKDQGVGEDGGVDI